MNCEEGETNINGINNDSIVGQSASKIDPTQYAVMTEWRTVNAEEIPAQNLGRS